MRFSFSLTPLLKPIRSENGNERKSDEQRADEGEGHGVCHRMEKFAGGSGERVDRQIAGDNHGDGIENRPIHVVGRVKEHFVSVVFLAVALAQFAVDVLDHHDRAVNDDSEIDGADGEQIGGFAREHGER